MQAFLGELRTRVDPSQITGFWPLLALLLIVGEGIALAWLFQASGESERIIAGALMVLVAVFVLGVAYLAQRSEFVTPTGPPEALGRISPATEVVTQAQTESPEPRTVSAPDASFIINRPPADWTMEEQTVMESVQENLGIADPSLPIIQIMVPDYLRDQRILVFKSNRETSIIPVPGKTKIDGRTAPSALEITIRDRLAVWPLDRAQPPLFIPRPFEHNFFSFVGRVASSGTLTLQRVFPDQTQRRLWRADFFQKVENATVNGDKDQDITTAVSLIGVEGALQDHLIYVYYTYKADANGSEQNQEVKELQTLANSFKPTESVNAAEVQENLDKLAEDNYNRLIAEGGEQIFYTEFSMVLSRIAGTDLDDPKARYKAIELLTPFEALANTMGLEDDDELDDLWESLHQAEEGDASNFKESVKELIAILQEQEETDETT